MDGTLTLWQFTTLLLCLFALEIARGESGPTRQQNGNSGQFKALLVGCTNYDFNDRRSLRGPANDVDLMHKLLVERFGFAPNSIRRLVDDRSPEERPTRANIVREIEALIAGAKAGQKIVLFFAGHGSQQPDQVPADPNDPEPDGLDEVFLPCDIGPWNRKIQSIQNAIVDDEIRRWIEKLLASGTELIVIFDACHSGSAIRGGIDETTRHIEPAELIPADVISSAKVSADPPRRETPTMNDAVVDGLAIGKWVGLYAAQPDELTVEMRLPLGSASARNQGLFTYTLCQTLRQTAPSSYRELVQRIRGAYLTQGRYSPTPMLEGIDLDRTVLGSQSVSSSFQLEEDENGQWRILAGQLHGCTVGSILAVRSPQTDERSDPEGYVEVIEAGLSDSIVRPCSYQGHPPNAKHSVGALCRLIYIDHGDQRLKIAIDTSNTSVDELMKMHTMIERLSELERSPIRFVDDFNQASWVLMNRGSSDHPQDWVLLPKSDAIETRDTAGTDSNRPVQFVVDVQFPDKAAETFQSIARATSLLGLTSRLGGELNEGLHLKYEVFHRQVGQNESTALRMESPNHLKPGGTLQFKLTNQGREAIDFNLLFVDSLFGVQPVYPRSYAADNRLSPGRSFETKPLLITADTTNREHMVLIATPSQPTPANFLFLAQSTLTLAKQEMNQQRGNSSNQPFQQFLEFVAYRSGNTRGVDIASGTNQPVVKACSWIVEP